MMVENVFDFDNIEMNEHHIPMPVIGRKEVYLSSSSKKKKSKNKYRHK
jgi:hypothetical protein